MERKLVDKRRSESTANGSIFIDFTAEYSYCFITSDNNLNDKSMDAASSIEPLASETAKSKRHATVYDAVAGRISAAGFISDIPVIAASRDIASSSLHAVAPEEVLFRKKNAPVRYEETDFYFASDLLPSNALPESDLLKALHCYTSDFYARATTDRGQRDWKSMDETALLALGILMEETCRETLGATGDLVFTEGDLLDEDAYRSGPQWEGQRAVRSSMAAVRSGKSRARKRRRYNVDAPST